MTIKLVLSLALGVAFLIPAHAYAADPQPGTRAHFAKAYDGIKQNTPVLREIGEWATTNCHNEDPAAYFGFLYRTGNAADGSRPFTVTLDCMVGRSKVTWRTVRFNTANLSGYGAFQKKQTVFLGVVDMGGYFLFAITRDPTEQGDPPIEK